MSVRITGPANYGMFKSRTVSMTPTESLGYIMNRIGSESGRDYVLAKAISLLAQIALKDATDETKAEFYNSLFEYASEGGGPRGFKAEIV